MKPISQLGYEQARDELIEVTIAEVQLNNAEEFGAWLTEVRGGTTTIVVPSALRR